MRLLVLGCGSVGSRHAVNAARLTETAVYDPSPEALRACAATTGAKAFDDLDRALEWSPDAVVVAAPTSLHISLAYKAVAAGAHVMIEKPLSHTMEGLGAFLDFADGEGRFVFVACNMRFHPAVEALKRAMPHIGRPLYARAYYGSYLPAMRQGRDYRELYSARRKMGGGIILDAIHELDYLMWFFGPVSHVECHSAILGNLDIDAEDFADLCLTHRNGVRSLIQVDFLRRFKHRGCELVGADGIVTWQSEGKNPQQCHVRRFSAQEGSWRTLLDEQQLDGTETYGLLMERFLTAIRSGGDSGLLSGRQAAEVLAVALSARKASRVGRRLVMGSVTGSVN